jgi:thiaminase/transcriptional activator TenA
VGEYIARQEKIVDNPYQKWIDTYGGEDFAISVQQAIAICDQVAANTTVAIRNKMSEAFVLASRLEYQFWEAAYDQKVWN